MRKCFTKGKCQAFFTFPENKVSFNIISRNKIQRKEYFGSLVLYTKGLNTFSTYMYIPFDILKQLYFAKT